MPDPPRGPLLDEAAGRLVRPYTVCDGRTRPTREFDLMTMVVATGTTSGGLGLDHAGVLRLCEQPVTVAEIAGHLGMPATVVKVLLSDLVERGAVVTRPFDPGPRGPYTVPDREVLEALRDGLLKKL